MEPFTLAGFPIAVWVVCGICAAYRSKRYQSKAKTPIGRFLDHAFWFIVSVLTGVYLHESLSAWAGMDISDTLAAAVTTLTFPTLADALMKMKIGKDALLNFLIRMLDKK